MELATVVNLPLIGNIFKKADYIRKNNIIGLWAAGTFGNMLSANTAAFNYFLSNDAPDYELKLCRHSRLNICLDANLRKQRKHV